MIVLAVVMTGTLKAGDYIQLGFGNKLLGYTKCYKIKTGDGTLEIWPSVLDLTYSNKTAVFNNALEGYSD